MVKYHFERLISVRFLTKLVLLETLDLDLVGDKMTLKMILQKIYIYLGYMAAPLLACLFNQDAQCACAPWVL